MFQPYVALCGYTRCRKYPAPRGGIRTIIMSPRLPLPAGVQSRSQSRDRRQRRNAVDGRVRVRRSAPGSGCLASRRPAWSEAMGGRQTAGRPRSGRSGGIRVQTRAVPPVSSRRGVRIRCAIRLPPAFAGRRCVESRSPAADRGRRSRGKASGRRGGPRHGPSVAQAREAPMC